jgi:hypothetical protein
LDIGWTLIALEALKLNLVVCGVTTVQGITHPMKPHWAKFAAVANNLTRDLASWNLT